MVLNGCRRAHGAGYRHGNRNGCLKRTRENVLNEIEKWTEDLEMSPVFWLNGLAGTGKSTIAQTVAERLFADGRLGASFFCSRGVEDRSDLQLIFPTLAFQLAQMYPDFRTSLIPLLQSNPDIVHESLQDQMQRLLIQPLLSADISTVIVIDALDECKDEDPESAILLVLGKLVSEIPRVKFFVTSRPETHISSGFRGSLLRDSTHVFILHEVEPYIIDNDIRRFFKLELSRLPHRGRDTDGWPTDEHLDSLCRRAAGFFVYAVATVNFLKHKFKRPSDRLGAIMKSPESTAHEGKAELKSYTSLDSLYTSILQEAFLKNDAEDDTMVRSVLSAVVLAVNPLSPSAVAKLMGFECDVVLSLLESIQSILALRDDVDHPAHPFHKSFPDFITDSDRCTNTRFYISPDYHTELVLCCLRLMDESLEKNMCLIPDYVLNSEVDDLPKRIDESGIRGALEYACRSWYKHLIATRDRAADMMVFSLRGFLERKFLFWLEVLSVLGAVGDAARALNTTVEWLTEVCGLTVWLLGFLTLTRNQIRGSVDVDFLLDTTTDCLRFVTGFFDVIQQSGPHIYHSALPLAPLSSVVRKLYSQQICSPVTKIVTGIPALWDLCTASVGGATKFSGVIWSPSGRFIATGLGKTIQIRDSNTLERVSVLNFPTSHTGMCLVPLAFSADGRLLACKYQKFELIKNARSITELQRLPSRIFVFDVQTGVIVNDINHRSSCWVVFSWNHRTVTLLEERGSFYTYDGSNGTCIHEDKLAPSANFLLGSRWVHEGFLRFPAIFKIDGGLAINIQEFRPASTPPLLLIESFLVPPHDGKCSFSSASFHASFITKTKVVILNVRDSRILLQAGVTHSPYTAPLGRFSPNGHFFAYSMGGWDICIWKNTPTCYVPWSNIQPRLQIWGFSFSPTKSSILTWGSMGIQLLEPGDRPNILPPEELERPRQRRTHLVARSADGTHIATVRQEGRVVTVLDPLSNTPRQFLDANMSILDIKIVDNAIFAAGRRKLVKWHLEAGGIVYGSRSATRVTIHEPDVTGSTLPFALSSDCSRITFFHKKVACLYDVQTQRTIRSYITGDSRVWGTVVRSSPDGRQPWFAHHVFNQAATRHTLVLAKMDDGRMTTENLSDEWSWVNLFAPPGWYVGGEREWVTDSRGNKLLWLPFSWRTWEGVRWDGNFLAFVDVHHTEPIIIEFQS